MQSEIYADRRKRLSTVSEWLWCHWATGTHQLPAAAYFVLWKLLLSSDVTTLSKISKWRQQPRQQTKPSIINNFQEGFRLLGGENRHTNTHPHTSTHIDMLRVGRVEQQLGWVRTPPHWIRITPPMYQESTDDSVWVMQYILPHLHCLMHTEGNSLLD